MANDIRTEMLNNIIMLQTLQQKKRFGSPNSTDNDNI